MIFRPKVPYIANLRFSCGHAPKEPRPQHSFPVLVISVLGTHDQSLLGYPGKLRRILLSLLLWECGRLVCMILEVLCLD